MSRFQSVRLKVIENMEMALDVIRRSKHDPIYQEVVRARLEKKGTLISSKDMDDELRHNEVYFDGIVRIATHAKSVIFPSEQASVFLEAIKKIDFDFEYILPFPDTIIQFSEPISVKLLSADNGESEWITKGIGAILLSQRPRDDDMFNVFFLLQSDLFRFRFFSWFSNEDDHGWYDDEHAFRGAMGLSPVDIKNLVIACIGYINCENVYLQRMGEVPDAINAKRERKGKSRLEPYYVCRIRGVQYDSAGNPTGEGAKHGIRYDVRGHFRRMTDGRTTWVRPHQRGLANELYVPKTYVVAKP